MPIFTILSFIFFTGLVGFLTWRITRGKGDHTANGYFLAGRSLTGSFIAGSLLLTNLSTEQLVGLNGAAFTDGICVMAWEVIAGMSLVFMALYFLPRYLRSGIATVPQFLAERYDGTTRTITSLIFIVAYAGILLPIILYTGATGLAGILDLNSLTGIESDSAILWMTVWLIGIIGSIYAIFGGLRSVAVSDTLNGIGLLIGGVAIAWFGLNAVNSDGVFAALSEMKSAHPEKFNSIGGPDQSVPFSTLFTGVLLLNLFYWCTNQQIIQRTFGASNLKEGQKGVLIAGVFKILAPLILVLPGVMAFTMFGQMSVDGSKMVLKDAITEDDEIAVVGTMEGEQKLTTLYGKEAIATLGVADPGAGRMKEGYSVLSDGKSFHVERVLAPGAAVLAGEDGANFYVEKADLEGKLYPRIADKSYGALVRAVLPEWLAGFFAAVMIGAILSSFNSALNSTATLFSLGVYKHLVKHDDASDAQVIKVGKIFGGGIAILAMVVAPLLAGQDSIFGYLQKMNGLYFIPIFAVVLMGLWNRRTPAAAANIALVVGFATIALGYFVPTLSARVDAMNGFHFLGAVFGGLMLFMFVFSRLKPTATPWEHKHSGDVDLTPWKWARPVGFGLIAVVLLMYVLLADTSVI
jgi:SSS family solute:Na+ symporter